MSRSELTINRTVILLSSPETFELSDTDAKRPGSACARKTEPMTNVSPIFMSGLSALILTIDSGCAVAAFCNCTLIARLFWAHRSIQSQKYMTGSTLKVSKPSDVHLADTDVEFIRGKKSLGGV